MGKQRINRVPNRWKRDVTGGDFVDQFLDLREFQGRNPYQDPVLEGDSGGEDAELGQLVEGAGLENAAVVAGVSTKGYLDSVELERHGGGGVIWRHGRENGEKIGREWGGEWGESGKRKGEHKEGRERVGEGTSMEEWWIGSPQHRRHGLHEIRL